MNPIRSLAIALAIGLPLAACISFNFYASSNEEDVPCTGRAVLSGDCPTASQLTRAQEVLSLDELPNGIFVGIALSGGGSRAANFSAAILSELNKLGFLDHVAAISSVSGSSLTAGYYGLHSTDPDWDLSLRKVLLTDFERIWVRRFFYPQNALRLLFTHFDRSDLLAGVFDSKIFNGARFRDMPRKLPRIWINATQYNNVVPGFVFSDETFAGKRSRLDTYPISHAVMASAALPGVFHNVTLSDFALKQMRGSSVRYVHLYDAGPLDNLGMLALLNTARSLYRHRPGLPPKASPRYAGCFFFIVDSYGYRFLEYNTSHTVPEGLSRSLLNLRTE